MKKWHAAALIFYGQHCNQPRPPRCGRAWRKTLVALLHQAADLIDGTPTKVLSAEAAPLWQGLAQNFGWRSINEIRGLVEQGSFDWLIALLRTEDRQQVLQELQQSALCVALLMLRPRSAVGGFIEDIRTKTANWREAVLETLT